MRPISAIDMRAVADWLKFSPPSESHSATLTALARVIITVLNNKPLIGQHKVSKLSYWLLYGAAVM